MALSQLPAVTAYYSPAQTIAPIGANPSYVTLANAAQAERANMAQRAADRQNAVLGGYQQMIGNNRMLGDRAYQTLQGNYDALTADAKATRERNLARVDQYGNSMRQDLAIAGQQAMAKARQSAIQRGLGGTTILDSLARGQQFDNQRQQLALEDQLLQNRIATDSNLSATYQSALGNRAQALNNQANQNIGTENQLGNARLGYLGSIQDDTQGFDRVSGLYQSLWQAQDAAQQAELDRQARNPGYNQPQANVGVLGRARVAWR